MKPLILLTLLASLAFLPGCISFNTKTSVIWHDGKEIKVSSKSDAVVTVKMKDGVELIVDNRGKAGIIEQFFAGLLIRAPRPQNSEADPVP